MRTLRYYRSTRRGSFCSENGTELRFLTCGYGNETVVVIPGIDDAVLDFHHVPWFWAWYFRPLADPARRIVLLGRPRGLPESTSIATLAATYASVIDRQLGRVSVVGISMGGMIAQHLAASRPDLVRRLVLAVTAMRIGQGGQAEGERLVGLARARQWHAFAVHANRICFAGLLRVLVALVLLLLAPLSRLLNWLAGGSRAARDFEMSAVACKAHDGEGLLAKIEAPTLLWGASQDVLFPATLLQETAAQLTCGDVAMVEGAHAAFVQERGQFHTALDAFLSAAQVPRRARADVEVAVVVSRS